MRLPHLKFLFVCFRLGQRWKFSWGGFGSRASGRVGWGVGYGLIIITQYSGKVLQIPELSG